MFVLRSVTSSNDPQQEAATSNRHADPVPQKSVDSVASEPVFDMVPHGGMTVGSLVPFDDEEEQYVKRERRRYETPVVDLYFEGIDIDRDKTIRNREKALDI